jgi:parallel beta-helix repeat protein
MNTKLVLATFFIAVLIGTIGLSFEVQRVEASGTIYIRADGSIDPLDAPLSTFDNVTYTLTGNINDSIVVERDNIVVDGAGYTVSGVNPVSGVDLSERVNVTIKGATIRDFNAAIGVYLKNASLCSVYGNNITDNFEGIVFDYSSNNSISGNNITANSGYGIYSHDSSSSYNSISGNNIANNDHGISLTYSSGNNISGNNITANTMYGIMLAYLSSYNSISGNNITASSGFGIIIGYYSSGDIISGNNVTANSSSDIELDYSSNNSISGNDITANGGAGIDVESSSNNSIFHNNLLNNTQQVASYNSSNVWDNGYPSGGN